jgi:hypothetical protein
MSSFMGMIVVAIPLSPSAVYLTGRNKGTTYAVYLFLYDATYNVAYNPLFYPYLPEILPFYLRPKFIAGENMVEQLALIINMDINPIVPTYTVGPKKGFTNQ